MSPLEMQAGAEHATLMRRATYAAVATAVCLIAVKCYAWWLTDSVSLLASLVDSLMDAAASLLNLVAVRYALKPADEHHRFGHGKAESLAALAQAAFILVSCVFLINEAAQRLMNPQVLPDLGLGIGVMSLSIVITGALVMYQLHVVRRTRSAAIRADSVHYRADLYSNVATVCALLLTSYGVGMADPVFGLLIAAWLLVSIWSIGRDAVNTLLDRELPDGERRRIIAAARHHPRVLDVHDVRTRLSGRTPIVQMHIELDPGLSLLDAHRIAEEVEASILAEYGDADVVIHQDPAGVDEHHRWSESTNHESESPL